jgi:peptidoglycan/LPS O-acetylase OafA/YrhL
LVARDADVLAELARNRAAAVCISMTSLDVDLRSVLEPRASPPVAKLRAIRKLADAGVPVGVLCLCFYALGYLLTLVDLPVASFMEPPRMVVVNTFFGRCFEFLLGIWVYKRFRDVPPWRYPVCTWLGLTLMGGFLYFSAFADGLTVYSVNWSPAHHFLYPLFVAMLILGLWKERSALARMLGSPLLVTLGKASYVFYLIHAAPFQEIFGIAEAPVIVRFVALNLVAILGFHLWEQPWQRLLRSPLRQMPAVQEK